MNEQPPSPRVALQWVGLDSIKKCMICLNDVKRFRKDISSNFSQCSHISKSFSAHLWEKLADHLIYNFKFIIGYIEISVVVSGTRKMCFKKSSGKFSRRVEEIQLAVQTKDQKVYFSSKYIHTIHFSSLRFNQLYISIII